RSEARAFGARIGPVAGGSCFAGRDRSRGNAAAYAEPLQPPDVQPRRRGTRGGEMRYMLFIYPDRSVELSAAERAAIPEAVGAWVAEMEARGVREQGHVLAPADEARTVRVRGGDLTVGEGRASSEEQISGFNILDCRDLAEAIEVAAGHPVAAFGTLEL